MAVINTNRFSLPVESFLQEIIQEQYPDLNVGPGSAIYDLLITPMALMLQPFRDRLRVMYRNSSIDNYPVMLPEELSRLAANFFVTPRGGNRATGVQRLFFSSPRTITITKQARFTADTGEVFRPLNTVSITSNVMQTNVAGTGEYYVDVPSISENEGVAYNILTGRVGNVSGVAGVNRTTNITDYFGGVDFESNSEIYSRIKKSIANRDLVKSRSIEAALLENFDTITDVRVIGFKHPAMDRDIISVNLIDQTIFEQSFAQKVNLPLNSSGEVQFTDETGKTISAPTGGYVGAIYDLTGKDYYNLSFTLNGTDFEKRAAQPNFKVRLLNSEDGDFNSNNFIVTRVESVPVEVNGSNVTVLRLNKPFTDIQQVDTTNSLDTYPYALIGSFTTNRFHIGGKVDVFLNSSRTVERSVIVSALPPINENTIDASEVPLTDTFIDSTGENLFEGSNGFQFPTIFITSVQEIDPVNDEVVLRELILGDQYVLVRKDSRGKFTQADEDVLIIKGSDPVLGIDGVQIDDLTVPSFTGKRIKINYLTNPDVLLAQSFIDNEENRDITKDIVVRPPEVVLIDIDLKYSGSQDVELLVKEYISKKKFGSSLTVTEIVNLLLFLGVQNVIMPVKLKKRVSTPSGDLIVSESDTEIKLEEHQLMRAENQLSITRLS